MDVISETISEPNSPHSSPLSSPRLPSALSKVQKRRSRPRATAQSITARRSVDSALLASEVVNSAGNGMSAYHNKIVCSDVMKDLTATSYWYNKYLNVDLGASCCHFLLIICL